MTPPRLLLLLAAAALLAVTAGCRPASPGEDDGDDAAPQGEPLYEKNKGVRLPPDLRRDLGVETVELTERPVPRQLTRPLQVFRAGGPDGTASAIASLEPAEAGALAPGQTVSVAGPGPGAPAVVGRVAALPGASAHPGLVEVVVELPAPAGGWPVGRLLTGVFPLGRTNTVPVVPASAVIDGATGPFVYTENDRHFVRTPVQLGAQADGFIEVTGGLYAGDRVVAQGAASLWTIELCALKGGTPCCPVPLKKDKD